MHLFPFNLGDIIGPIYSFILCCMRFKYRDDFIYIYIYILCGADLGDTLESPRAKNLGLRRGPTTTNCLEMGMTVQLVDSWV